MQQYRSTRGSKITDSDAKYRTFPSKQLTSLQNELFAHTSEKDEN